MKEESMSPSPRRGGEPSHKLVRPNQPSVDIAHPSSKGPEFLADRFRVTKEKDAYKLPLDTEVAAGKYIEGTMRQFFWQYEWDAQANVIPLPDPSARDIGQDMGEPPDLCWKYLVTQEKASQVGIDTSDALENTRESPKYLREEEHNATVQQSFPCGDGGKKDLADAVGTSVFPDAEFIRHSSTYHPSQDGWQDLTDATLCQPCSTLGDPFVPNPLPDRNVSES